jgi:predicted MFS family arabinose efflux permease
VKIVIIRTFNYFVFMERSVINMNSSLDDSNARSPRYQTGLLIMMFCAMGFVIMDRMLPLYLGTFIIEDLGLSNVQFGTISTTFSVGWALSAVILGYVSDRIGRRKILIPAILAMSIFSAGTGLVQMFVGLLIMRLVMGISEAPSAALIPGITQAESPPEKRGRNTGIVLSAGSLVGSVLAPVLGVRLALEFGWRPTFYIIGIPGIILGLIMLKFLKEPRVAKSETGTREKFNLRGVVGNKNVWLCAVAAIGLTGNNIVYASFAPLLMTSEKGFSPETMSNIVGVIGFSGFLWTIIVPAVSDRIGRRAVMMIFGCLAIFLPISIIHVSSPTLLIVCGFLLNSVIGLAPIMSALVPAESVGPKLMGTALGINLLFGDLIGGSIAPVVGGALADSYGYAAPLYLCAGLIAILPIMGFFMKETAPRFVAKAKAAEDAKATETDTDH